MCPHSGNPTDAFGTMVRDYYRDALAERPRYRRDDGDVTDAHLEGYFEPPDAWSPAERALLDRVDGLVFDAGCGVGRHALALQHRGRDVLAVDRSPGAVAVARDRGVESVAVGDLTAPPLGPSTVDSAVVLGKQLGLGASLSALRATLDGLATAVRPGGRLVADLDALSRREPAYLDDHALGDGAAYRRFRVEYDGLAGPWTDLLLVDPDRFRAVVERTPWTVETLVGRDESGSDYGVVLRLTDAGT